MAWHLACESELIRYLGEADIWTRPWIATGRTVILTAQSQPVELTVWQVVMQTRIQRFAARQMSATRWYFALQRDDIS